MQSFDRDQRERICSRARSCSSDDDQKATSTLSGISIESHIQTQNLSDFGRHLFVAGVTQQTNTVIVQTNGTRPVTLGDISIVPDNQASVGQFTIVNHDSLLITHAVNSSFPLPFSAPATPGNHCAQVVIAGDFSPCDDSTTTLTGSAYTLSAHASDLAFGTILTCFDSTGQLYLENTGSDPIQLVGIESSQGTEFSVGAPGPATRDQAG